MLELEKETRPVDQVCEMCVLDRTGDTRTTWNPKNKDEVAIAKKAFDDFTKKGFAAFSVNPEDGSKDEQIHEFDPQAAKIIFVPQIKGGAYGYLLSD